MHTRGHSATHVRRQVLFVQGAGEGAHDEWDSKLVASLQAELGADYEVRYPRMPNEDDPHYAAWRPAIEKELAALDDDAILVGHSIGGTMLVNVLAEQWTGSKLGALFLIAAPFVGDGGWPSDEFNSSEDLGLKLPKNAPVHIYHGLEDEEVPPAHADLYASAIPQAKVHRVTGRDHQFNNDLLEVAAEIKSLESKRI
jgi:predicted alpha/beta hydrolase family esterase